MDKKHETNRINFKKIPVTMQFENVILVTTTLKSTLTNRKDSYSFTGRFYRDVLTPTLSTAYI